MTDHCCRRISRDSMLMQSHFGNDRSIVNLASQAVGNQNVDLDVESHGDMMATMQ